MSDTDQSEGIGFYNILPGGVPAGMDVDDRFHWFLERRRLIAAGVMEPPPAPRRFRVLDANGHTTQAYSEELTNPNGPTER